MNPSLGQLVLAIHLAVIAFNIGGLIAIPLGAVLGWRWVRTMWWRVLHLGSLAVTALQALLGRACFLTDWQNGLTGGGAHDPLLMRWVNAAIYWPLPMWVFTTSYVAVFVYVTALWWLVRPQRRIVRKGRSGGRAGDEGF
ncbi:DUF2784 domain-containing protein [uncultured Phenylobacterium sp.]|uniref:DUF2784 domain-containing protein n=1 Tax=uncultured Phenylobacterium sp. TaxID=349273 RepID=UPI0025E282E1|nr:DUF2784 domain-containing protein [uncultured Phenylobacterium sp.]